MQNAELSQRPHCACDVLFGFDFLLGATGVEVDAYTSNSSGVFTIKKCTLIKAPVLYLYKYRHHFSGGLRVPVGAQIRQDQGLHVHVRLLNDDCYSATSSFLDAKQEKVYKLFYQLCT